MTAPATTTATVAGASSLTIAASARAVQLAIRARLMKDVLTLWPVLDAKRLDETFPGWLRAMILLVTNYHGQSSQAAAAFYRQARRQALDVTTPGSVVRLAPDPSPEWLTRALGYAAPGMLTREAAQPGTALSTTLGTASRIALDGGRTTVLGTVKHDPRAVGYYRVTDGHPCAFCALLASRGVVYKKDTAGFQAHNDCGCSGAPAFSRSQEIPEISRVAAQVYIERGSGDALVAFRKAWAEHQAQTG